MKDLNVYHFLMSDDLAVSVDQEADIVLLSIIAQIKIGSSKNPGAPARLADRMNRLILFPQDIV